MQRRNLVPAGAAAAAAALAPMPTPNSGHGLVVLRGRLLAMRGEGDFLVSVVHEAFTQLLPLEQP